MNSYRNGPCRSVCKFVIHWKKWNPFQEGCCEGCGYPNRGFFFPILPSGTDCAAPSSYMLSVNATCRFYWAHLLQTSLFSCGISHNSLQKYLICSAGLQFLDKVFLQIGLKVGLKVLGLFFFGKKNIFLFTCELFAGKKCKELTERKIDIILMKYLDLEQYGFVF